MRAKINFITGLVLLALFFVSFSSQIDDKKEFIKSTVLPRIEIFTFMANGTATIRKNICTCCL
jgi:hypothetical protein